MNRKDRCLSLMVLGISAASAAGGPPAYSARTILPDGARRPAPLAPGKLMSVYGERLGPATGCTGQPDPRRQETPSPLRPHQSLVERQVFPTRLCGTEVRVGGQAAGLLYVHSSQINFKVPQEVAGPEPVPVQVFVEGQAGPAVTVAVETRQPGHSAADLAARVWAAFQRVAWEQEFRPRAECQAVAPHPDLRGGLYGYVSVCPAPAGPVLADSCYYPADEEPPVLRLRRADFRLADPYPHLNAEVEMALRARLTRAYGPPAVPDALYEIGIGRREATPCWRAGPLTVYLHRNRTYVAPSGVREGVQLIAVRREVLEERARGVEVREALGSTGALAPPRLRADLAAELGALYPLPPAHPPATGAQRARAEKETRLALLRLLTRREAGNPHRQAALLVAADDLAVRLGALLVVRTVSRSSESIGESPTAGWVRNMLAPYGVRYTGIGHYSGDLESDRALLVRAWKEHPESAWGQRAFLIWQRLSCVIPGFGCEGPRCFLAVAGRGEEFLRRYPGTPFRKEQLYHLALAYETWWSLSQKAPGDPRADNARIDPAAAERARRKAMEFYEQLIRLAPDSPEAAAGRLILPRLRLRLGTGERAFFCSSC